MKNFLIVAFLLLSSCTWLEKQNLDLCVDYHGRHICVGRKDGAWTVAANDGNGLTDQERSEIIKSLE